MADLIGDDEPLFPQVLEFVLAEGQIDCAHLQQKFEIGYARAARILDLLEERGVITPADGLKPRLVIRLTPRPQIVAPVSSSDLGLTETEPEQTEFDATFEKEIAAIPPNVRIVMEKLAFKIKNEGLNIDEACLICNVDPDWIAARIEEHPVIARSFAKKELEYRMILMKPMRGKAKVDEKMAQYLLELRTPKVRKNAAGTDPDESKDMLALAIAHIQEHGDSTPLVKRSSGAAVLMARGATATKLMDRIRSILPA